MAWHQRNPTVKQGLFGGDLAVSLNIMNANRVAEIWCLHATYCLEALPRDTRTLCHLHATVDRTMMRLGIHEIQMRNKGRLVKI